MSSFLSIYRFFDKVLMKLQFPKYEQYISTLRTPTNAKIVLLGHKSPILQNLIARQFANYNKFTVANYLQTNSAEPKKPELLTESVAENLKKVDPNYSAGHILLDYPQSVNQAQELEEALNGVNLAIKFEVVENLKKELSGKYLVCGSCGKTYNLATRFSSPEEPGSENSCETQSKCNIQASQTDPKEEVENTKELEEFYEKRGLLLKFRLCPKKAALDISEVNQKLSDAIERNIKL